MRERIEYFAIGAITGAVIGLVAGLLFAPATGQSTRRKLADEARRAANFARTMAERAEEAAEMIGGRVDRYLGGDEEIAWRKVREIREGVQRYAQAQTAD